MKNESIIMEREIYIEKFAFFPNGIVKQLGKAMIYLLFGPEIENVFRMPSRNPNLVMYLCSQLRRICF